MAKKIKNIGLADKVKAIHPKETPSDSMVAISSLHIAFNKTRQPFENKGKNKNRFDKKRKF
jgi:hypothetical protein